MDKLSSGAKALYLLLQDAGADSSLRMLHALEDGEFLDKIGVNDHEVVEDLWNWLQEGHADV